MNVTTIGNSFGAPQKTLNTPPKPVETAGTLAFGGSETAGTLANNAGGSFCALA